MPNHEVDATPFRAALESLVEQGFEGMANAMTILLNEAMKLERAHFIGAEPYQRSVDRRAHANGFKPKSVKTRAGELELRVPQVRGIAEGESGFYPSALERGVRSERALKLALAEMFIQGVSTRKVRAITQEMCGFEVSSTQVSRAAALLDDELEAWRTRTLASCPYLLLDARYEKVRHAGAVRSCAVLVAIGVRDDGKRSILGVSVKLSEAEVHWREFLSSLFERGLNGVRLVASDDHEGLKAARIACMPSVPWQRCQFHLQQNAAHYVPKLAMRREVADCLRGVFNAPDREQAERLLAKAVAHYQESAPKLAEWMDANVAEGLNVFLLEPEHRRYMRTTNALERINEELKRRTRVATLFPNEASLLRLVSAILAEISEDWETGRIYLSMNTR